MNIKDMDVYIDGDVWHRVLHVKYKSGPIVEATLEEDPSKLIFLFHNGQAYTHNIEKFVNPGIAYLSQFGISVSGDGTRFFIQSWEKGLFCFDMQTGELRWHNNLKKAYNLVILDNVVVCHCSEKCIMVLDLASGEMLERVSLGYGAGFWPLDDTRYLIGPKRGKYRIIDENLKAVTSISFERFNPNSFDTFIVLDADIVPEGIQISGFEYADNKETNVNNHHFSRKVICNL